MAAPIGLGALSPDFQFFEVLQHVVAVITLVGHDFVDHGRRLLGVRVVSCRLQVAGDAHAFLMDAPVRFSGFDLVIDCTASDIFQMELEHDGRRLAGATPPMISIGIEAEAKCYIGVNVPRASTGDIWDAYLQLQYRICPAEVYCEARAWVEENNRMRSSSYETGGLL